ncbi:MAG: TnpV protein, partial [Oscillospiraceae bacterium]|nr:TnpV protein [Oscillospiraceae bacterium]
MENSLTYTQVGDYLLPNLTLDEQPERDLGKYGRMRRTYLKEHRPGLFNQLVMNGT